MLKNFSELTQISSIRRKTPQFAFFTRMCAYLLNFTSKSVGRDAIATKLNVNVKVDEAVQQTQTKQKDIKDNSLGTIEKNFIIVSRNFTQEQQAK